MATKTDAEYAAMTMPKRGTCAVGQRGGAWYAVMTQDYFDELLTYSCSTTTGAFIGKRWKSHPHDYYPSHFKDQWYMCAFEEHPDPTKVTIVQYVIEVGDPAKAGFDPPSRVDLIE